MTPHIGSELALSSKLNLESWCDSMRRYVPQSPIANLIGIPAISVPVASGPAGLPLGMQFFGAMGTESKLLDIAHQLEVATPWRDRRPAVFAV
jgi:amidase